MVGLVGVLGPQLQFNLWLGSGWPKGPGGVGPSNDGYPIGNNLFYDAIPNHKFTTCCAMVTKGTGIAFLTGGMVDGPLVISLYRQNVPEEGLLLNYDTPRKHGHQNSHNWKKNLPRASFL